MADEKQRKTEEERLNDLCLELTRKELRVAMVNASARLKIDALLENKSQDYVYGFTDGLQFERNRQEEILQIWDKGQN